MKPSLIVHGGAWDIPDEAVEACKSGCHGALDAGWSVLSRGGSALDVVEAAIVVLEDEPVFDAGFGSHLNLDGRVECDAIVMNGATLRAGAVAALQRVRNPIRLARAVLEHCPHMMLVAEGAERFAIDNGIALCDPAELVSDAEREAWRGLQSRKARCSASSGARARDRGSGCSGCTRQFVCGDLDRRDLLQASGKSRRFAADRVRVLRGFDGRWRVLHGLR
jgi:isoaspartyl peptidase/L-asparaginase-like protein (Ntn-hydrolase superfamily)